MIRLLLEIVPRVIVAVLLFSVANTFINSIGWGILDKIKQELVETISLLASLALSIAALIYPTPLIYLLAIVSYSIATRFGVSITSPEALLSIGAMAAIDHLKSFYRNQQERFVEVGLRGIATTFLLVSAIIVLITAFAYLANAYLLSISPWMIASKTANSFLREIAVNPIFILSFSIAIGVAIYRIVTVLLEVIAIYVGGSREAAIRTLGSREDVDVYIEAPLTIVKSFALSAIFTPPIYTVISMFLPLPQLPSIYTEIVRGAIATIVFIAMGYAMYRLEKLIVLDPKALLALSLATLLLIYVGGVMESYSMYKNVFNALIAPSISRVIESVSGIYTSFYTDILILLEDIAKLFGVAP